MTFSMHGESGPVVAVLDSPRRCPSRTVYGAAVDALRVLKKLRTHGVVRVASPRDSRSALIEYDGTGPAVVTYHSATTLWRGHEYGLVRRDVCDVRTQQILATRVWPTLEAAAPYIGTRAEETRTQWTT